MTPKLRNTCRRIAHTKGDRHKRAKVWQAMRILREFTCDEVGAVCELENVRSIRTFACLLARAGYLHVMCAHRAKPRRYRLVRNTGPKTPHVIRAATECAAVYDPNTDQEYSLVQS